jgi:hypothetical protein
MCYVNGDRFSRFMTFTSFMYEETDDLLTGNSTLCVDTYRTHFEFRWYQLDWKLAIQYNMKLFDK